MINLTSEVIDVLLEQRGEIDCEYTPPAPRSWKQMQHSSAVMAMDLKAYKDAEREANKELLP